MSNAKGQPPQEPGDVNAFITQKRVESRSDGRLSGITIAVKDNISIRDIPTTCGSAMLEEYVPPFTATVVTRLLDAGATVVGKTNMDEFGMGTTTETSAFGPTKNPIDHSRVPGGSSGGSAAAVVTGDADMALGSDTGGSIRCPASFCGVVGIKPTYGLVSRYGLVAYANSLEQIGPIASSVSDAALLLDVISGYDEHDSTSRHKGDNSDYVSAATGEVTGVTIGVPRELMDGVDLDVLNRFETVLDRLEAVGATIQEVTLPSIEHAVAAYYVIAMSEASSNLARYDGVRYGISGGFEGDWNQVFARAREKGFGDEVKRRILLGTYALSAGYHKKYYKKAQDARAWITRDFNDALSNVDVLVSPTMPTTAFKLGEGLTDPLQMYLMDANTVPVNLANVPAISVPIGTDDAGLPVGAQVIGGAFDEEIVIRVGSAIEQEQLG